MAEMERFELSRRDNRPTPLAGAPLRPLEYISVYSCERPLQNSHTPIIPNFYPFVNTFLEIDKKYFPTGLRPEESCSDTLFCNNIPPISIMRLILLF